MAVWGILCGHGIPDMLFCLSVEFSRLVQLCSLNGDVLLGLFLLWPSAASEKQSKAVFIVYVCVRYRRANLLVSHVRGMLFSLRQWMETQCAGLLWELVISKSKPGR